MRKAILALLLSWQLALGSGAGLYCVKSDGLAPAHIDGLADCIAGKIYTQISAAKDALNTDQGTATFTATQTIRVYPGTYGAIGYEFASYGSYLHPTAEYPWIITSVAPSQSLVGKPVVDCGSTATDAFLNYDVPYITITGLEWTNCHTVVTQAYAPGHFTFSYNYSHDIGGYIVYAPGGSPNSLFAHNVGVNFFAGIIAGGAGTVTEWNELNGSTAGDLFPVGGGTLVQNNIGYNAAPSSGSGLVSQDASTATGNVVYSNRYGFQGAAPSSPGPTFTYGIAVGNMWTCHYECAGAACFGLMQHNFCYDSTDAAVPADVGIVMRMGGGAGSQMFEVNNISWPNKSNNQFDLNVYASTQAAGSMSDHNIWWQTGTTNTEGVASIGGTVYATLAAYQATGWDTHSFSADPRIIGDPNLLATTSQVFPECPTIECRLAKIRRNYMPTNLALKGRGCTFNISTFACVPDGSDIGPVPITTYNSPGGIGSGGAAF